MNTLIRRLVIFPIALALTTVILFVNWCFNNDSAHVRELLEEIWDGTLI